MSPGGAQDSFGRLGGTMVVSPFPEGQEDIMREMRQLWVEPGQVRGEIVREGQLTTLVEDVATFALRRWDGGEPVTADTVVKVIETRSYGAMLVSEIPDAAEVLEAIVGIRGEVRKMERAPGYVRDEYREQIARLNALIARFPEPVQWVEA